MAVGATLPSRQFPSPHEFVIEFMATLMPGVIPRSGFIKWPHIATKTRRLSKGLAHLKSVRTRIAEGGSTVADAVRDELLLPTTDVRAFVGCCFEILGHTRPAFVTADDDFDIAERIALLSSRNPRDAESFGQMMDELGLGTLLKAGDLDALLLGVQLGLETHRRKNVGGTAFRGVMDPLLREVAANVAKRTGRDVRAVGEHVISYAVNGSTLSKQVDMALFVDGAPRFGIEINFYTGSGSKPQEIKNSYGTVRRGLASVGVDLLWVTDGRGYRDMMKNLADAYVIHPNIYNARAVQTHLEDDLVSAL